jgi:hypothetical protein
VNVIEEEIAQGLAEDRVEQLTLENHPMYNYCNNGLTIPTQRRV